jgi:hypothetical protein
MHKFMTPWKPRLAVGFNYLGQHLKAKYGVQNKKKTSAVMFKVYNHCVLPTIT